MDIPRICHFISRLTELEVEGKRIIEFMRKTQRLERNKREINSGRQNVTTMSYSTHMNYTEQWPSTTTLFTAGSKVVTSVS